MSEAERPRTYRQNRLWLRRRMVELERMSMELRAFTETLSFPDLAELEEMGSGRRPWTREVCLAAIAHRVAFYVEEAWCEAENHLEMASPDAERRGLSPDLLESFRFAVRWREKVAAQRGGDA